MGNGKIPVNLIVEVERQISNGKTDLEVALLLDEDITLVVGLRNLLQSRWEGTVLCMARLTRT